MFLINTLTLFKKNKTFNFCVLVLFIAGALLFLNVCKKTNRNPWDTWIVLWIAGISSAPCTVKQGDLYPTGSGRQRAPSGLWGTASLPHQTCSSRGRT